MKRFLLLLSLISAHYCQAAQANTLATAETKCAMNGAFSEATDRRIFICSNGFWQDGATLNQANIEFSTAATYHGEKIFKPGFSSVQWVGVPFFFSSSNTTHPAKNSKTSNATPSGRQHHLMVDGKVSRITQNTAHVILNLTVADSAHTWRTHIDTTVRLGTRAAVAKDDAGIEYLIAVNMAPQ